MKEGGGSVSQCLDAILIWDPQGFCYYYYRAAATGECVCRTEVRAWQCEGCALIGTARVAESSSGEWARLGTRRDPFSFRVPSQRERKKKRCSVFILPFFHFPGGNQNIYRQETRKERTAKKAVECALKVWKDNRPAQKSHTVVTVREGKREGGRSVVPWGKMRVECKCCWRRLHLRWSKRKKGCLRCLHCSPLSSRDPTKYYSRYFECLLQRQIYAERGGRRDLKLSCNLCNFCPEGVDSCQGVGTGPAVSLFLTFFLGDKATHLFCKYCVRKRGQIWILPKKHKKKRSRREEEWFFDSAGVIFHSALINALFKFLSISLSLSCFAVMPRVD